MAERIKGETFEEKVLKAEKLALVEFYSDSCVPCKRMSPLLAELEETYKEQVYIGKVNTGYEKELTSFYHILSTPTCIFFRDGKEVARTAGAQKKGVLTELIEKNLI